MAKSIQAFETSDGMVFTGELSKRNSDNHETKVTIKEELQNLDLTVSVNELDLHHLEVLIRVGRMAEEITKNS